jgi:hypothetical protein
MHKGGNKRRTCVKCKKKIERSPHGGINIMYCSLECKKSITSSSRGFGSDFIKKIREETQGV